PTFGARARRPGWTRCGAAAAEADRMEPADAARIELVGRDRTMAEIITRTFELSLGHRFRLYAEWMAGRARREAEAARAAAAAVVAAKGRAVRAEAGAAVRERARPAVAPSPFPALPP